MVVDINEDKPRCLPLNGVKYGTSGIDLYSRFLNLTRVNKINFRDPETSSG